MTREEALGQLKELSRQRMKQTDCAFWEQLYSRRTELIKMVSQSLAELADMAEQVSKDCLYVYGYWLRMDVRNQNYTLYLQAQDQDGVLDLQPEETCADLHVFFEGLKQEEALLKADADALPGKICSDDIAHIIADKAGEWFQKIAFLLRIAYEKEANQEALKRFFRKEHPFLFRIGEYRGDGETVLLHDERSCSKGHMHWFLQEGFQKPFLFQCGDFRGGTCENMDFSGRHLEFAVFRNCDFSGSDFSGSALAGTRFISCKLDGCIFRDADFLLARFESCQISDAVWENAAFGGTFMDGGVPSGLTDVQRRGIVLGEDAYEHAVFLCGAGPDNPGWNQLRAV